MSEFFDPIKEEGSYPTENKGRYDPKTGLRTGRQAAIKGSSVTRETLVKGTVKMEETIPSGHRVAPLVTNKNS